MQEFLSNAREWLNEEIVTIGGQPFSPFTALSVLSIFVATFWFSKWLRKLVARLLHDKSAASTLGGVIHYAVLLVGFSVALSTAGVNLTGLFAAGAIFAVGIGFAMQSIVQNFVSGVILLAERSITPEDVLEVEGNIVKVIRMGIRASIVQSRDGEEIIIPNSILAQNSVRNFTLTTQHLRVRTVVGVSYSSDMRLVRKTLEEVAGKLNGKQAAAGRPPLVVLKEFGDNSVNWEVGVWTADPWNKRPMLSELNEAIWDAFKNKSITIAFPQLDVHFEPEIVSSIAGLRKIGAA